MTTMQDEFGTTIISEPRRTRRMDLATLKAGGWQDMNRSGCRGEWRRTLENTDTLHIQEVYSAGTLRTITWRAA